MWLSSSFHSWGIANCWIYIKIVSSGKPEIHVGLNPQPHSTNSTSNPRRWGWGRRIKSQGRQLWSSLSVRGVCDRGKKNSKTEKLFPQQSLLSATEEPMALTFCTERTGFIFHIRVIWLERETVLRAEELRALLWTFNRSSEKVISVSTNTDSDGLASFQTSSYDSEIHCYYYYS